MLGFPQDFKSFVSTAPLFVGPAYIAAYFHQFRMQHIPSWLAHWAGSPDLTTQVAGLSLYFLAISLLAYVLLSSYIVAVRAAERLFKGHCSPVVGFALLAFGFLVLGEVVGHPFFPGLSFYWYLGAIAHGIFTLKVAADIEP